MRSARARAPPTPHADACLFPDQKGGVNWFFSVVLFLDAQYSTYCIRVCASAGVGVPPAAHPSLFCTSGAGAARIERILAGLVVVLLFRGTLHPRGAVGWGLRATTRSSYAVAIMFRIRARFDVGMNE